MTSILRTFSIWAVVAIALFNPINLTAQGMPVYDNTNFISLAKQLLESAKQTSEMIKTVKFLKEQKDNIMKVAGVVQDLKAVQDIHQNNQQLFSMAQNDLQQILNSPYIKPEEINRVTESFNLIIENSMDDLQFINKLLSSDLLKMSDGERTEMIRQRQKESKQMVASIRTKTKRYKDIIAIREFQDAINNRETGY